MICELVRFLIFVGIFMHTVRMISRIRHSNVSNKIATYYTKFPQDIALLILLPTVFVGVFVYPVPMNVLELFATIPVCYYLISPLINETFFQRNKAKL